MVALARSGPAARSGDPGWRNVLDYEVLLVTGSVRAAAARRRQDALDYRACKYAEFAAVAAQLGVPTPQTRDQALPLLVAAGLLTVDEAGRYSVPVSVPRAPDVLSLPPERVRQLDRGVAVARYTHLASDLVTIACWAAEHPWRTTVPALARRLLATEDEVRAVLGYATEESLVELSGVDDALQSDEVRCEVRRLRPVLCPPVRSLALLFSAVPLL